MLTEQQKVDVRRHCGFPVYGNGVGASPPSFGYRYYTQYLILEYRLDNLDPDEETTLINDYILNCNLSHAAIQTSSFNLSTDRAAVWWHNKREVKDRFELYKLQCQLMIQFLGLDSPGKLINGISMVV